MSPAGLSCTDMTERRLAPGLGALMRTLTGDATAGPSGATTVAGKGGATGDGKCEPRVKPQIRKMRRMAG